MFKVCGDDAAFLVMFFDAVRTVPKPQLAWTRWLYPVALFLGTIPIAVGVVIKWNWSIDRWKF